MNFDSTCIITHNDQRQPLKAVPLPSQKYCMQMEVDIWSSHVTPQSKPYLGQEPAACMQRDDLQLPIHSSDVKNMGHLKFTCISMTYVNQTIDKKIINSGIMLKV